MLGDGDTDELDGLGAGDVLDGVDVGLELDGLGAGDDDPLLTVISNPFGHVPPWLFRKFR